ncbi:hypothetical protein GYA49_01570 [Candidatus Beckwithbacteria bacterium]|nr:hypothetical protein [Candidatus Beckwithbacteria bacterium]
MRKSSKLKTQSSKFLEQKEFIFIAKYANWLALIAILIYSLLVWWPTKLLPYHWDSAGFVINSAVDLLKTNFNPLIAPYSDFAHPPLLIALLALSWKLFGQHIIVSHLLMFSFLPILMFSTYLIGKKITDSILGLVSAFIIGTVAVVVAEYGLIYIDLPVAALGTAFLAAWLHRKHFLAGIILSLAALIKIPILMLIIPILAADFLEFGKKKLEWKKFLPLLLPITGVVIWLIYHKNVTGWWLVMPGRGSLIPKTIGQFLASFGFVSQNLLLNQYRFSLLILGLSGFLYVLSLNPKIRIVKPVSTLGLTIITGIMFFTLAGEFGLRYGIFLLPAYVLTMMYFVHQALPQKLYLWPVGIMIVILFLFTWHPKIAATQDYEFRPPENLSYQDLISIGRQAALFVSVNFPQAKFYGGFPENYQLEQPYQGYVDQGLDFSLCKDFKPELDKIQIIYLHPYSPTQIPCRQLLDMVPTLPLNKFEKNGKWLELYMVDASATAQLIKTNTDSAHAQEP